MFMNRLNVQLVVWTSAGQQVKCFQGGQMEFMVYQNT